MSRDGTKCPSHRQLEEFFDGRGDTTNVDWIGDHLGHCSSCLDHLDSLDARHDSTQQGAKVQVPTSLSAAEFANAWQMYAGEAELQELCDRAQAMQPSPAENQQIQSVSHSPQEPTAASRPATPRAVADYNVTHVLGEGAFSRVYLGSKENEEPVAIKVPLKDDALSDQELEDYLDEARKLSELQHPAVVKIVQWGRWNQSCFVASEWIDGLNLRKMIQEKKLSRHQRLQILAQIADGLQHVHERGLVHRDVKPANIVVAHDGQAYLVDFGLAIREDQQWKLRGQLAGTRPYMAPEQLRGETHRLDGRTDIWALGVVLYELLTGRRPFRGEQTEQLTYEIEFGDPKPIRQFEDSISEELDRICMKCLQKRMTDRYRAASDLARDLNRYLDDEQTSPPKRQSVQLDELSTRLRPPGLRSFEMGDAEVFCALWPGLRDADGVPENIRFLADKLTSRERDATFPVGVIYGPSGSGKSSFIRAGILPRLKPGTRIVSLEASKDDFESRLLDAMTNALVDLEPELDGSQFDLPELFERTRRIFDQRNEKFIVILDQLEQWLSKWDGSPTAPFIAALRHCNGCSLQAILTVRDDFWLATSRLMQSLERQLVPGENAVFVDLFLPQHAVDVLQGFGRAYDRLPPYPTPISASQKSFLELAITELASNGRVAPVQIAFFAEVLKYEKWEPHTLKLLGGVEGIGIRYLERTFTLPTAPITHRQHAKAIQNVLRQLLWTTDTAGPALKGPSRSLQELSVASGYSVDSNDFQDLLSLLEVDTKLITLVDPNQKEAGASWTDRRYQLAHDYLVPSLREWLARTEALTTRGRTRQMLQRLHSRWSNYEDSRHLPRLLEWLQIRALIPSSQLSESEAQMLRQAQGGFFRRGIVAACLGVVLIMLAWHYSGIVGTGYLTDSLVRGPSSDIPALIKELDSRPGWAHPQLREILLVAEREGDAKTQRRVLAALVGNNSEHAKPLLQHYRRAPLDELKIIIDVLDQVPDSKCELNSLWDVATTPETPSLERLRIAALLAHRSADDVRWEDLGEDVVVLLIDQPHDDHKQWATLLSPAANSLLEPLAEITVDCPDRTTLRITSGVYNEVARATSNGYRALDDLFTDALEDNSRRSIEDARRAAAAAAALATAGRWDALNAAFRHTEDPTIRSYLIEYLVGSLLGVETLTEHLQTVSDPSIQQGLILAIGDTGMSHPPRLRGPIVRKLLSIWGESESPGVRHAVSWTLRRWEVDPRAAEFRSVWSNMPPAPMPWKAVREEGSLGEFPVSETSGENPLEQPMVAFSPGSIIRVDDEGPRIVLEVVRPFAIATTEVTVTDFLRFRGDHPADERKAPKRNCPVNSVTWYDAVAYCNWLSKECGIPEAEWCYLPNAEGLYGEGMVVPKDSLERQGFRLPTATEWEFACRGSARTSWSFGNDSKFISEYAWLLRNAGYRSHSVGQLKPNERGLFDMHGNVWEWCHDKLTLHESRAPFQEGDRRLRGGTYIDGPHELSFNAHNWNPPSKRTDADGFRICRTLPQRATTPSDENEDFDETKQRNP